MEERSTSEMLAVGKRLIARAQYDKAYRIFKALYDRRADLSEDDVAIVTSYYGLMVVRHLRQWDEGHQLCAGALEGSFYLPETYVNLARIYLDRKLPPFRRKAEKLLESALKVDPTCHEAQTEIQKLEGDRFQALSFLSPDNAINRLLAKLMGKG